MKKIEYDSPVNDYKKMDTRWLHGEQRICHRQTAPALVQFNWGIQASDIISIIFLLLAKRYSENLSNDTHNCLKLHPFFCDGLHSAEKLLGINAYCHA